MQDDSDSEDDDDDDDVIDVDAGGRVPGQAGSSTGNNKGLLSSLPGGERINYKELADMEDIDWCVLPLFFSFSCVFFCSGERGLGGSCLAVKTCQRKCCMGMT